MRTNILGVGFDNITKKNAVNTALGIIDSGEKAYIVTPNPEIVWLARDNARLLDALHGAGLVLADGVGITIAAKILKTPLQERIPGIDFAAALFEKLSERGGSLYLFGAKPGVAEIAGENLLNTYPGLKISGVTNGYFTDSAPIVEKINEAKPDVLLCCLGAPKQELWMVENLKNLDVKLCLGLGGSLDVYAGVVKRAPKFFQKAGLEWLYRLLKEPRRIKRMIKLPLFLLAVLFGKRQ